MGQADSRHTDSVEVISLDVDVDFAFGAAHTSADSTEAGGPPQNPTGGPQHASGASSSNESRHAPTLPGSVQFRDYRVDNSAKGMLGQGTFAKVKLATHPNGHQVAVKIIKRKNRNDDAEAREWLQREVKHQNLLRHENIVRLHSWLTTPKAFLLVMEYCPSGDMLKYLQVRQRLRTAEARYFFGHLCEGLAFCHSLGISHRDLKLENLMLCPTVAPNDSPILACEEFTLKIADFGLSDLTAIGEQSTKYWGSPLYAAPELVGLGPRDGFDACKADVWSSGVILYALLTSQFPFDANDMRTLIRNVTRGTYEPVPDGGDGRRKAAAALVDELLSIDPYRRPSARAILTRDWMKQQQTVIMGTRTLEFLPQNRAESHVESQSLGLLPSAAGLLDPAPLAEQVMASTPRVEPSLTATRRSAGQTVTFFRDLLEFYAPAGKFYGLTKADLDQIKAENAAEGSGGAPETNRYAVVLDAALL